MKVQCTGPWWYGRKLYLQGDVVEVPAGTPVPTGFVVDGKATPSRPQLKFSAKAERSEELDRLKAELADLKARSANKQ